MKRIISFILALITAFSLSVTVFAADTYLKVNEKKTVTMTAKKNYSYKFKAPSDGRYTIDCKVIGEASIGLDVYSGKKNIGGGYTYIDKEDARDGNVGTLYCVVLANAKTTYDVKFIYDPEVNKNFKISAKTFKVEIKITKQKISFARLGKNEAGKSENSCFLFKPDKDGYYSFTSNKCDICDPAIIIENNEGLLCANEDSGVLFDRDFDQTAYLHKDEVYLIEIFNSKPKKTVSFTVSFNKKYSLKKMRCSDKGTVKAAKGLDFYGAITAVPNGAIPTAGIKAVSKDPKVASVDFDPVTGEYYVVALNPGKTTIKFTAANGISTSFKLKVI